MQGKNYPPVALGPADNHKQLHQLMQKNNTRHGRLFHYFDFHVFKGKLWCMFEVSPEDNQRVKDATVEE